MLIYARYTCKNQACPGALGGCIYGGKLLGTARALPGTEPRVSQLDAVPVTPSVPPTPGGCCAVRVIGVRQWAGCFANCDRCHISVVLAAIMLPHLSG